MTKFSFKIVCLYCSELMLHALFYPGIGKKQGRNEFVIRLQPSEAMYMKLTVRAFTFANSNTYLFHVFQGKKMNRLLDSLCELHEFV